MLSRRSAIRLFAGVLSVFQLSQRGHAGNNDKIYVEKFTGGERELLLDSRYLLISEINTSEEELSNSTVEALQSLGILVDSKRRIGSFTFANIVNSNLFQTTKDSEVVATKILASIPSLFVTPLFRLRDNTIFIPLHQINITFNEESPEELIKIIYESLPVEPVYHVHDKTPEPPFAEKFKYSGVDDRESSNTSIKCCTLNVTSNSGFDSLRISNTLIDNPLVCFAHVEAIIQIQQYQAPPSEGNVYGGSSGNFWTPGQNNLETGWWLSDAWGINVVPAWNLTQGSKGIRIAVLGVGFSNSDINTPNYPFNTSIPRYGFTLTNASGQPVLDGGSAGGNDHEDIVASLITAKDHTGNKVGIAPGCLSISMKMVYSTTTTPTDTTRKSSYLSIRQALYSGCQISNRSGDLIGLNSTPGDTLRLSGIYQIARSFGMVHFGASGNLPGNQTIENSGTIYAVPARMPSVFSINGYDSEGRQYKQGQIGDGLDFSMPATLPGNDGSGTSWSSPMAAGVAALMLSSNPSLNVDDIWGAMVGSAKPLNSLWLSTSPPLTYSNSGSFISDQPAISYNIKRGWGRIDAGSAVDMASSFWHAGLAACPNSNDTLMLWAGAEKRPGYPRAGWGIVERLDANGSKIGSALTVGPFLNYRITDIASTSDGNPILVLKGFDGRLHIRRGDSWTAYYDFGPDSDLASSEWRYRKVVSDNFGKPYILWNYNAISNTLVGYAAISILDSTITQALKSYTLRRVTDGGADWIAVDLSVDNNGFVYVLWATMNLTPQPKILITKYDSNSAINNSNSVLEVFKTPTMPCDFSGSIPWLPEQVYFTPVNLRVSRDGVYKYVVFNCPDGRIKLWQFDSSWNILKTEQSTSQINIGGNITGPNQPVFSKKDLWYKSAAVNSQGDVLLGWNHIWRELVIRRSPASNINSVSATGPFTQIASF